MKFAFVQKDPKAEAARKSALLRESLRQYDARRFARAQAPSSGPVGPATQEEYELAAKCAILRGEKTLLWQDYPLSGKRPQGKSKTTSPQRAARAAAHQALLASHAAAKAAKAGRVAGVTLLPEAMVWRRLRQLRRIAVSGLRLRTTPALRLPSSAVAGPRLRTSHWTRARLALLRLPEPLENA